MFTLADLILHLDKRIHVVVYFFSVSWSFPSHHSRWYYFFGIFSSAVPLVSSHAQSSASKVCMGTLITERRSKFVVWCCGKAHALQPGSLDFSSQLHQFLTNCIILCKLLFFVPQFSLCEIGEWTLLRIKVYNMWCILVSLAQGDH